MIAVDNQAPYIILGSPLFVEEGGTALLTQEVVDGHDIDTPSTYLRYYVTMQPGWGHLENTGPESVSKNPPGHAILSFTLADIENEHIRSVLS